MINVIVASKRCSFFVVASKRFAQVRNFAALLSSQQVVVSVVVIVSTISALFMNVAALFSCLFQPLFSAQRFVPSAAG